MKKRLLVLLVVFYPLLWTPVFAQDNSAPVRETSVFVNWSVGIPIGEMISDVKKTSGRGVQFGVNQQINDKITYGGQFGWQSFYEQEYEIKISDESIATGWQKNYINAFFMMVSGRYYFATSVNNIKAYLGGELGATIIENEQIFGLYQSKELEWHFAVTPTLGIDIPANDYIGFNMFLKLPYSVKNNASKSYSWLNTGIGMYFKL